MTNTQSRARLALLGLVLLVVALLAAACAGGGQAPAPTQAPQAATPGAPSAQPQSTQPPAQEGAKPVDLPAGVDANGNFYLGDPNASVKLEEWSDFQ